MNIRRDSVERDSVPRFSFEVPLAAWPADPSVAGVKREAIAKLVTVLSFDDVTYLSARRDAEARALNFHMWSTVDDRWLAEYDLDHHAAVDPLLAYGWERFPAPLLWDRSLSGNATHTAYLDRAALFGIGSGLTVYFRDYIDTVIVTLSWNSRNLTAARRMHAANVTASAVDFAFALHWLTMKHLKKRLRRATIAYGEAATTHPLSQREINCLELAARGMTSADIAVKLGITARTTNYHFGNLIRKLRVLNRKEAIAFALTHSLLSANVPVVPFLPTLRSSRVTAARRRWSKARILAHP